MTILPYIVPELVGFKTTFILDPYGIHNVESLFWPFTFYYYILFIIPKLKNNFLGELKKPIHHAAIFGYSRICKFILERTSIFNPIDNEGWTPLHLAAQNGHETAYKLIMEKLDNKNPMKRNGAKETPLHIAAGRVSFLKMS